MTTTAAFFDLDGTLLSANSGSLWMAREWRHGRISPLQAVQGVFYLAAYRLGVVDMEKVTIKALETVKGEQESLLRQWTRQWFEQEVIPHVAPRAPETVRRHRDEGHRLVLLTSSSVYESEAATEHFGLHDFLCMRYEVRDGRFTGDVVRPICFGAGKVHHAEKLAARHGISLEESYFYTDSITDLPMLLRVGHPRAVNPDYRLRRRARREGWPILDWSSA
jgi:HAD superfamily hydrolase (TIGR01490 family)